MSSRALPARPIRVLYLSWKRAEWSDVFADQNRFNYREVSIWARRDRGIELLRKLFALARAHHELEPDVLVLEAMGLGGLIALGLRAITGTPIATRIKGDVLVAASEWRLLPRWSARVRRLLTTVVLHATLARTDRFLAISPAIADQLRLEFGNDHKLAVVPIPLAPAFRQRGPRVHPGDPRRLLTITNFHSWAKIEPLLVAIPILAPFLRARNLKLDILGDGEFFGEAKRRLATLSDHVHLRGHQPVIEYLDRAGVFLYVSGADGLPNALLEAASRGLPLLVQQATPAAAFIDHDRNGRITDFLAPDGCLALAALLADSAAQRRLGEAAAIWVREEFSLERVRESLAEALKNFIGRDHAA